MVLRRARAPGTCALKFDRAHSKSATAPLCACYESNAIFLRPPLSRVVRLAPGGEVDGRRLLKRVYFRRFAVSRPIAADVRVSVRVCVCHTPIWRHENGHAPWTRDGLRTRVSVKKVNELPSRRPGIAEAVNGALGLRSGRTMVSTSLHINDGRRIMLPTVAARLTEA